MKSFGSTVKTVVALAGVAMAVSCAEGYEQVDVTADDLVVGTTTIKTMTIQAARPSVGGDTRVQFSTRIEDNVSWQAGDKLGVYIYAVDDAENKVNTYNERYGVINSEDINPVTGVAMFTGNFNDFAGDVTPASVNYYAYLPYSAVARGSDTDVPNVKLTLPATQKPRPTTTFRENKNVYYYYGSYDSAADILFGSASTTGEAINGTDVLFDFVRPFAIGKFTFTGIPTMAAGDVDLSNEDVKSVRLTFTSVLGTPVAGAFTVNLASPTPNFDSTGVRTIKLDYTGQGVKLGAFTTPVYWVMNPLETTLLTVRIEVGNYSVAKTFDLVASPKTFRANALNHATVSLSGASVTEINLLETDTSTGEGIYIPDANFRERVSMYIAGDSFLTPTEAAAVSALNVNNPGQKVADLTGVEYFTGLTTLNCPENNLTSLDVSANTALTSLNCSNNNLTSLDVTANTLLNQFNCSGNPLLETLTFGANTGGLVRFNCMDCKLAGIDLSQIVLSKGYGPLDSFDCSGNPGDSSGNFNITLGYDITTGGGTPAQFPVAGSPYGTGIVVYHYNAPTP
jgi:hypothetical protein